MSPLATSLMFTMRAGRAYTAANLARLHSASVDALNAALHELVSDGRIRPCYNARRERGYCSTRPESQAEASPPSDDGNDTAAVSTTVSTTVATFPVTRRLEGALTDYGSSINAHRALAMLARR